MSLLTEKPWIKKGLLGAAGLGAGVLAIYYVHVFNQLDPLANVKKRVSPIGELGIRVNDVKMVHYKGGKKVAEAKIGRLDVRRDRQFFDLYDVEKGAFYDGKEKVEFETPHAQWNASRKMLEVVAPARVKTKDFDLKTDGMRYSENTSRLTVPGKIEGKLLKGTVVGKNFVFDLKNKTIKGGPSSWNGELTLEEIGRGQRSSWKIENNGDVESKGGFVTYNFIEATDGDVIIRADKAVLETKTEILTATGNVLFYSPDADMRCTKAVVYRKEKRALLSDAEMVIRPKDKQDKPIKKEIPTFKRASADQMGKLIEKLPDDEEQVKQVEDLVRSSKNIREHPMSVASTTIEYWYAKGKRRASITGSPEAHQEFSNGSWRHVWTHRAEWDGETETLQLFSSPGKRETRMINSLLDDLTFLTFRAMLADEGAEDFKATGMAGSWSMRKDPDDPRKDKKDPPDKKVPPPGQKTGGS